MERDRFTGARRVRHILSAWMVWWCSMAVAIVPLLGPPAAGFLCLLGLLMSFRVIGYGHRLQGLVLLLLYGMVLVTLPLIWQESVSGMARGIDGLLPGSSSRMQEQVDQRLPKWARTESRSKPASTMSRSSGQRYPFVVRDAKDDKDSKIAKAQVEILIRNLHAASRSANASKISGSYSNHVLFRGSPLSRYEVVEFYTDFWREWPERGDHIASQMITEEQGEGVWVAKYTEEMKRHRPGDGRRFEGRQKHLFRVRKEASGWKIIAEEVEPMEGRETREELPVHDLPAARSPEAEIRALVLATRKAETRRDIAEAMQGYGERVFYFGRSRRKDEIRADKQDYFNKWPRQEESIEGQVSVLMLKHGYASVKFRTRFQVSNPVSGEWRSGFINNSYTLLNDLNGWKITQQDGEVLGLRKGTTEPKGR